MPDIGGRVRAIEAREVFEEGLHIPLTKLVREGRTDETLVELVRANVRTPDQTMGDIWAQAGANGLMERRLLALMEDYRLDTLDALGEELFGRAERAMRAAIRAVPDGTYRYALRTDGVDQPVRLQDRADGGGRRRSSPTTPARRRPSRAPSTACSPTPMR